MKYYATYEENGKYPIILVEFKKGNFKNRKETKTGEIYKTSRKAMLRTGELNENY